MANAQLENYALASSTNFFSAIWALTRALKAAGYTHLGSADGSAKNTDGATDKWGNTGSPLTETYPTGLDSVAAWWLGQGPSTLKIEMTSAPSVGPSGSDFIPDEPVTQATSGATGQFLGYDFSSGTGHAVILPRTGTFNGTNVITGSYSGATFTATAVKTFVREVLFWKTTNTTSGIACVQCVDSSAESSSRLSSLLTATGCTATVAPGGGGTGNSFPSVGSWAMRGDIATPTHATWFGISSNGGKAQILVANATPAAGVSADGSWMVGVGNPGQSATSFEFLAFERCEKGEPADIDPYVTIGMTTTLANAGAVRTTSASTAPFVATTLFTVGNNGSAHVKGWRRRGFATSDAFASFKSLNPFSVQDNVSISAENNATPQTIACSYAASPPRRLWPIEFESAVNTTKMTKGRARHLKMIQGGTTFDTTDTKGKFLIAVTTGSQGSIIHALADGSTTPTQT